MDYDGGDNPSSPSLKHKLKNFRCFSCCFGSLKRHDHLPLNSPSPLPSDDNPALIWVKTKRPNDHSLSEIKEKCRSMLGISGNKHKRYSSTDFSYDPLSYALNFEDGLDYDDAVPLKNFCARLSPSPPVASAVS